MKIILNLGPILVFIGMFILHSPYRLFLDYPPIVDYWTGAGKGIGPIQKRTAKIAWGIMLLGIIIQTIRLFYNQNIAG